MTLIKLVLANRPRLFRQLLREVLVREPDFEVVAECDVNVAARWLELNKDDVDFVLAGPVTSRSQVDWSSWLNMRRAGLRVLEIVDNERAVRVWDSPGGVSTFPVASVKDFLARLRRLHEERQERGGSNRD